MGKEWILNIATNRWGYNKKKYVGPVAEWIREASPKNLEEWKERYYEKLLEKLKSEGVDLTPDEYLENLGQKLYVKISEVLQSEISEITQEDCISYIKELVLNRTYEGYRTEIDTIYGQLADYLGVEIRPAPDEWDRLYNVDFYIEVDGKYIGLQIKPITYKHTSNIHKWEDILKRTHEKFKSEFGGSVFIVFSIKEKDKKVIYNKEIVEEIRKEIERLKGEHGK